MKMQNDEHAQSAIGQGKRPVVRCDDNVLFYRIRQLLPVGHSTDSLFLAQRLLQIHLTDKLG